LSTVGLQQLAADPEERKSEGSGSKLVWYLLSLLVGGVLYVKFCRRKGANKCGSHGTVGPAVVIANSCNAVRRNQKRRGPTWPERATWTIAAAGKKIYNNIYYTNEEFWII
jgi:hypothetical protein